VHFQKKGFFYLCKGCRGCLEVGLEPPKQNEVETRVTKGKKQVILNKSLYSAVTKEYNNVNKGADVVLTKGEKAKGNIKPRNIVVHGSSMVKGFGVGLGNLGLGDVTVNSFSGAGIEKIGESVKSTGSAGVHIVWGGGNDLGGEKTETLRARFYKIFSDMKNVDGEKILFGILPRVKEGWFWNRRAADFNQWLQEECRINNIYFICPWKEFLSNPTLYSKDQLHLSYRGQKVIFDDVDELCHHLLNKPPPFLE